MNLLAIDLVLLPPLDILTNIIRYNYQIIEPEEANLIIGVTQNLPHATIRMGLVEQKNIPWIKEQFLEISSPKIIESIGIVKRSISGGKYRFLININPSHELINYHKDVMQIDGFINRKAIASHFDQTNPINHSTINYVSNFEKYAHANFTPHITLGVGEKLEPIPPFSFEGIPEIFQLGNNCTCSLKM